MMRRPILLLTAAVGIAAIVVVIAVHRRAAPASALPPSRVTLIGDSLNVGVEPYLHEQLPGWTIEPDDQLGRPTTVGVEHVRSGVSELAPYVVVSLGTNDPRTAADAFRASVREILDLAGPGRCVVWATIHRGDPAYERFNDVLRAEKERNGHLRVVEWATMVADHHEWLASDGVHGSPDGYRERAKAIVDQLRRCPRPAA